MRWFVRWHLILRIISRAAGRYCAIFRNFGRFSVVLAWFRHRRASEDAVYCGGLASVVQGAHVPVFRLKTARGGLLEAQKPPFWGILSFFLPSHGRYTKNNTN